MRFPKPSLAFCILALLGANPLYAQESTPLQPTANTAFLEMQSISEGSATGSILPPWLESVEFSDQKSSPDILESGTEGLRSSGTQDVAHAVWRLRLKAAPADASELLFRLAFRDEPGKQPVVTVWTELGEKLFSSAPLGTGLGLPTSETVIVPGRGATYMEIEVPGDGVNVRGLFLTAVKPATTMQAVDFDPIAPFADPFHNPLPATAVSSDVALLDRVTAPLDAGIVKLSPASQDGVEYSFELSKAPKVAVVTFEVLNVDISYPPYIVVNGRDVGRASLVLPDLADPAYSGSLLATDPSWRYRYQGWLKAQCVVPGALLREGENRFLVSGAEKADAFAIRAVAVQMKYDRASTRSSH